MSPYSLAHEAPVTEALRRLMIPSGLSFIGLPAVGAGIDAAWLTSAIHDLLGRHERVMVLIESELMTYEQGAGRPANAPLPHPVATSEQVSEDTMVRWRDVDAVRRELPALSIPRVQIASWAHFIDPTFAAIWRHLLTASEVTGRFRTDVQRQASSRPCDPDARTATKSSGASSLCRVELLAMRLRIGEVAGYHYEYGAGGEGLLSERLYSGAYAADGLTVESLVGQPARRMYKAI